MSVDVGVEVCPGGGSVGAEVTLVHNPLLVRGQSELVLPTGLAGLVLEVAIDSVTVGHDTCRVALWFSIVENSVVKNLKLYFVSY